MPTPHVWERKGQEADRRDQPESQWQPGAGTPAQMSEADPAESTAPLPASWMWSSSWLSEERHYPVSLSCEQRLPTQASLSCGREDSFRSPQGPETQPSPPSSGPLRQSLKWSHVCPPQYLRDKGAGEGPCGPEVSPIHPGHPGDQGLARSPGSAGGHSSQLRSSR